MTAKADPTAEEVLKAWNGSTSQGAFLEALGFNAKSDKLAHRLMREHGLEDPATQWTPRGAPPEPELEPEERIQADTALDREKARRKEAERLYDEAIGQIRSQEDICAALAEQFIEPRPAPKFKAPPKRAKSRPVREVILQVSDWQMGQLVSPVDTGGINEYSWDIMLERLQRWVDAAVASIRIQQSGFDITRGVVLFCGDMVEGHDIFNGQPWQLDKDAAMQALDGSDAWASALAALHGAGLGIEWSVYCVPGNHGKPGGRRGGATPATFSFDHLFYELLRRGMSEYPWREWVNEPAGRLLFSCADHIFATTHGHEVRGWGGIPWYGLDKTQGRLMQEMETVFTYWLLGHWHQSASIPSGRGMRIINGNAVGPNQLSTAAILGSTAASQNLLYVSREFGVAEHAYLFLAPGMKAKPRVYGEAA